MVAHDGLEFKVVGRVAVDGERHPGYSCGISSILP